MTRRPHLAAVALALVWIVAVACGGPAPSPAPTPSPPTAPTVVLGDWTAVNGRWTFNGSVNPRGSPTDVVLEWGIGPAASPVYDQTVPVEEGMLDAAAVSATVDIGEDVEFCTRFTATNEIGSASSEPRCIGARPSGIIVVPAASDEPEAPTASP